MFANNYSLACVSFDGIPSPIDDEMIPLRLPLNPCYMRGKKKSQA